MKNLLRRHTRIDRRLVGHKMIAIDEYHRKCNCIGARGIPQPGRSRRRLIPVGTVFDGIRRIDRAQRSG